MSIYLRGGKIVTENEDTYIEALGTEKELLEEVKRLKYQAHLFWKWARIYYIDTS